MGREDLRAAASRGGGAFGGEVRGSSEGIREGEAGLFPIGVSNGRASLPVPSRAGTTLEVPTLSAATRVVAFTGTTAGVRA
jgi:hypothetical protein